jgi:acetoin utilization protein AcuB
MMIFFVGESPGTLLRAAGTPFSAVLRVPVRGAVELAQARVVCPRHGEIDGAECLDCPNLLAVTADGLRCRSSGADAVVEWMTPATRLVTTRPSATCAEAHRAATLAGRHHLLVLDDACELVGVACGCDFANASAAPIGAVMSGDVFATGPATSLAEARAAMDELGVGCLPIIDGGLVRGLVTRADLRRAGALVERP